MYITRIITKMMKLNHILVMCILPLVMTITTIDGRPQNAIENNQNLDNFQEDVEEVRNRYFELPAPAPYSGVPLDRLQMLIAQYRPTAYLRNSGWSSTMNDLFRIPESKRQVRYRQCYFNPISCFKK
ncbi:uncharacterized protein AstC [Eurosta solidaginis]|uniref:uncharacterized protein AstC n=1 Tax=Eurosta solidaginis TaxID=178769 RepID=UPI003530CFA9